MNNLLTLIKYIAEDLTEPVGYLPFGLIAGLVFLLLRTVWNIRKSRPLTRDGILRDGILFLIIIYAAVILKLAFFSRETGSRTDVSLIPFETWGATLRAHSFFLENIFMFIPFGVLLPAAFRQLRSPGRCTAAAFLASLCLELMQLATGRGFCQVDDLLTNTLGAVIGYLIFRAARNFLISRQDLFRRDL